MLKYLRRFLRLIVLIIIFLDISTNSIDMSICFAAGNDEFPQLVVGVPTDRCPMFYIDAQTKEIVGIGTDLMEIAAEAAGYNVVFKQIQEANLKEALDNSEYDVVMPFGSALDSAQGKATIVSDNLIQTPFVLVTYDKKVLPSINNLKIGMLSSLKGGAETVKQLYPGIEINLYDDMDECVNALRHGKVDSLLHNSYVWSYYLQKPSYENLSIQPTNMFSMDFRVAALDTPKGREIIEKINYGIGTLTDTQRQAVILDYTGRRLYVYSFVDYLYEYKFLIVIGIIVLCGLIVLLIRLQRYYKKKHEENVRRLIDIDSLTGVLSNSGFKKKVEDLLRNNPDIPYFISYNNIKDYKFINENFGRENGDNLLKFWADKSLEVINENEAIGRSDSDHFLAFRQIIDYERFLNDEEKVFGPVKNFFINQGKDYKVCICSGIYVLDKNDYEKIDVERMLDYARVAEKKAHDNCLNGFEFYNPEQWEKSKNKAEIVSRLSKALASGEIQVWYQPQVNYENGKVIGAEALCRWIHPKTGMISPSEFIPTLEETGLIYDLDSHVWNKVCEDLAKWNKQGIHKCISVNLSRYDIKKNRDIADVFANMVEKYGISKDQLHIEITETAYIENPEVILQTSKKLSDYGFKVEMDDFGSGYSSLNMLKDISVDRIKLDLHFMTKTGDQNKGYIILKHVITMIDELGIEVIAEGVETKEQADILKELGCKEMQGYYFYKTMPHDQFEEV